MRIIVNVMVGLLFGVIYWQAGNHGGKVLDNYNLLFSTIMHNMMSPMMLTILTCKYAYFGINKFTVLILLCENFSIMQKPGN